MASSQKGPGVERLEPRKLLSSASFVKIDTTTQGNWKGLVGLQGEYVFGSTNELPKWAALSSPGTVNVLDNNTTSSRAPLKWGLNTNGIAADIAGHTLSLNLNITDGHQHQVSLYVLDWNSQGLAEEIDVLDASSGTVLATQTVHNFSSGEYVSFNVTGDVTFRVTSTTAQNAVVNGIFLDPVGGAPGNPFSGNPASPTTAVPFSVSTDTTILQSRATALARGPINMLLVGDSITDFWQTSGTASDYQAFSSYNPLDIGVSGTTTQGCLAELHSGVIDGLAPKVAMVLIGTNDLVYDPNANDAQVAAGVLEVVTTLQEKLPDTRILLLGIFPRGEYANNPFRARIIDINNMVHNAVAGESNVAFRDIGSIFLNSAGNISSSIMSDYLHPTSAGYRLWATDVLPTIAELAVDQTVGPSAALTSAPALTTASSDDYTFTVTYTDNLAVNVSTLGKGNLTVTSAGYSQAARLLSTGLASGSTVVATYSIPAPAAGWSASSDGTYNIALNANQVADTTGNFAAAERKLGQFTVSIPSASGGALTGSYTAASSVNLTTLGTSDWAHWGTAGQYASFVDKATGGAQISNVSTIGSGTFGAWTALTKNVSWSDGTPLAADADDNGYLYTKSLGTGYSFTVPASAAQQTLYVYVGGSSSVSTLTAQLSDSSAPDYVLNLSGTSPYADLVAITFNAASSGQTLTISLVKSQNLNGAVGTTDLIAAALA